MKIKDITSKIGSGATPTGGEHSYKSSGISLIRSQNVLDLAFSTDGLAYIDEQQAQKLDGVTVQKSDVLLNITGDSIARCCMVPDFILPARVNQHVAIIRAEKTSPDYLLYFLQFLKPHLLQICKGGGTRNALTKEAIEELPFWEIDNSEQAVHLLHTIDEKITNNNGLCLDLEAVSKLLYDYWFVQFDFPDENGNPYKSSGGMMVWNEELKRDIPDGWNAKKLSYIADMITTSITPNPDRYYLHYSIPAFDESKMPSMDKGNTIDSNKYLVPENAILVSKLNPQFQRVWWIGEYKENSICSTEFMPFVAKNDIHEYLYNLLKSEQFYTFMVNSSSSSTGSRKRMQPELCLDYLIPFPNDDTIIHSFCRITNSLLQKSSKTIHENQQLASLRNFLLPLLMNGQVKIK